MPRAYLTCIPASTEQFRYVTVKPPLSAATGKAIMFTGSTYEWKKITNYKHFGLSMKGSERLNWLPGTAVIAKAQERGHRVRGLIPIPSISRAIYYRPCKCNAAPFLAEASCTQDTAPGGIQHFILLSWSLSSWFQEIKLASLKQYQA